MPKIAYVEKTFTGRRLELVEQAEAIVVEYAATGFDLTLRQLYYQFVARGLLENKVQNYKLLGTVVSEARRAGLIDWDHIVDRTRFVRKPTAWSGPDAILRACAAQFNIDRWATQPCYVEVWIEKDALVGVLEQACREWFVPYFSCRGYTSDSEAWSAAQRLRDRCDDGKQALVFHLGDHDPSGIDMTRDIQDRLDLFGAGHVEVRRLALNMDQVRKLNPPPNPAKETDSRFAGYVREYGDESWELDALDPRAIERLIDRAMDGVIDRKAWAAAAKVVDLERSRLAAVAERWEEITDAL